MFLMTNSLQKHFYRLCSISAWQPSTDSAKIQSIISTCNFCSPPETSHLFNRLASSIPGGFLTKFNMGRLFPEIEPLTLLYTILAEKVPLLYTFYWKKVPLSHSYFRKSCFFFAFAFAANKKYFWHLWSSLHPPSSLHLHSTYVTYYALPALPTSQPVFFLSQCLPWEPWTTDLWFSFGFISWCLTIEPCRLGCKFHYFLNYIYIVVL